MKSDTLLTYPSSNDIFKIRTYATAFQLGVVVIQKSKLFAFYSRKLTDDQQRYIVPERENLRIVETLKKFRTLLLFHKLRIYTDNKNVPVKIFNTKIVFVWILIPEEYDKYIEYIRGEKT